MDFQDCIKKGKLKEFSRGQFIVRKELKEAENDFLRANKTFQDKDYKWTIIQLYYSMFHYARVLIYIHNYKEFSHNCLLRAINEFYVKSGKLSKEALEDLKLAKNLREDADYYSRYTLDNSIRLIKICKKFRRNTKQIISSTKTF